ncbi:MAG TPA: hypothetical protein VNX68_06930 [Nitrosopumilaceae archaeon]|nr:hypothetical protein [Nitrosopumilaceae archaeon]
MKFDTLQYAVIKYKGGRYPNFDSAVPSDLSSIEIDTVFSLLKRAIVVHNRTIHNKFYVVRDLEEYKFQFVPIVNVKGEKIVWINAFCGTFGANNWKKDIVLVMDGGNCYFQAKINLTTKSVFEIGTNGLG